MRTVPNARGRRGSRTPPECSIGGLLRTPAGHGSSETLGLAAGELDPAFVLSTMAAGSLATAGGNNDRKPETKDNGP